MWFLVRNKTVWYNEVKTIEVSSDNPDYTHISNVKSGIKKKNYTYKKTQLITWGVSYRALTTLTILIVSCGRKR